ncbi:hypothetical protein CFOL_v3_08615 [Cephalotus follicularis]|uniref:Uncharacterized protein n=1 Tax=Cephalotus follicularis TaxID=3775 RepID=A0A1Q3BAR6_CEPFO|nr:hypothetical protein CFOL_v3_08615 [Cephalotus follicularis]
MSQGWLPYSPWHTYARRSMTSHNSHDLLPWRYALPYTTATEELSHHTQISVFHPSVHTSCLDQLSAYYPTSQLSTLHQLRVTKVSLMQVCSPLNVLIMNVLLSRVIEA